MNNTTFTPRTAPQRRTASEARAPEARRNAPGTRPNAAPAEPTEAQRQADAQARRTQAAGARNRVLFGGAGQPRAPEAVIRPLTRAQRNKALIQQWRNWASDPGVSNQQRDRRQLAVRKVVTSCRNERLDNTFPWLTGDGLGSPFLNLSGMDLEGELPPTPEHIKYLNVSGNASLTGISLSPTLHTLNASRCHFTALPRTPENLTDLDFSHNQITDLSQPTSRSTRRLDLTGNPITQVPNWMLQLRQHWWRMEGRNLFHWRDNRAEVRVSVWHLPDAVRQDIGRRANAGTGTFVIFSPPQGRRDDPTLIRQWETWATDPHVSNEQREQRRAALQRVRSLQSPGNGLDLSNLNLEGALPPIPRTGILRVSGNPRLTGFASLPPELHTLHASDCGLERLPHLPETLENLHVGGNTRLRTLPRLPPSLKGVNAQNCGLERLEPFPDGSLLETLNVSENPLSSLPRTPERLKSLTARGCRFTALPAIEGIFFRDADFSNNRIVDISQPRLPADTYRLNLSANPLRLDTLPHWMMGMGMECETHGRRETEVRISLGHLPNADQVRQRISEQLSRNNGPRVYFDMMDPSSPTQASPAPGATGQAAGRAPIAQIAEPGARPDQAATPLGDAVAAWLDHAPEAQAQRQAWRAFANEDGAQAFTHFLNRLANTTNHVRPATREPFRQGVRHLLTDMARSPQLRADCFAICIGATESCEDRVTLSYQNMAVPRLTEAVRRGDFDTNAALPGFIDQTRSLYRRELLTDIANRKAATMRGVDVIEVHLALQVRLNRALNLHLDAEQMAYFSMSGLRGADFVAAEREVKQSENQGFANHLINHSGPWAQLMQRRAPELYEQMIEAKHEAIEPQRLAPAIRARLAGLGLQNDADAVREAGRTVTDQLTLHAQQGFVRRFLREHDNHPERLLGPVWPA